jgi:two-component system phosphate regulon response regulator PhoB
VAGYKVIVAEENRVLLDVIRFNFVRVGFDVRTATEGSQVLRFLDEESADLLVTDWRMPGMSGLELCARIRSHAVHFNLPILFCTSRGMEIEQQTLDELSVPVVLCKPFSPRNLMQRAFELVQLRQAAIPR